MTKLNTNQLEPAWMLGFGGFSNFSGATRARHIQK